ncbi:MAG: DNA repair protein RecN [Pseudomonadota bacterium]
MLLNLQIRNFAIVDEIDVDFAAGMTVLTGETGAGKSIIVDALGLILGERGGSGLVRDGAKRAEFCAEFDINEHPAVAAWLEEQSLDLDGECLVRRVIGADGRSRAFLNGTAVTLQTVKSLGEMLADIHGQHFHQSLGRRDVQRDLLDHFGSLLDLRRQVAEAYQAWRGLAAQLEELRTAAAERDSRLDMLEFQVQELDALELDSSELTSLPAERQKLQNVARLAEGLDRILVQTYDAEAGSAQSLLASACQELQELVTYDETLTPALALLEESGIQLSEAADQLHRYVDSLEADPTRRDWVEDRLHAIQTLARKHRVEAIELGDIQSRLRDELDLLRNAGERGATLERDEAAAKSRFLEAAQSLSAQRHEVAVRFAEDVQAAMAGLGMPGGTFAVQLEAAGIDGTGPHGIDRIEYVISANPGQAPQPLSKVASGGELSRMGLAIQVIGSGGSDIGTMVFDEVDSGVGGGVAEMVGRRLCELGDSRQVLCVTHLPQVASQADHHLRINKITDGKTTRTGVTELARDERVEELARMLGGVDITRRTREHAEEMLQAGGRRAAAR